MSTTTGAGGLVKRFFLIGFVGLAGCEGGEAFIGLDAETDGEVTVDTTGQKFSSALATLMDFTFEAELSVPGAVSTFSTRRYIDAQMLFTIGHLNTDKSVGRLDKIQITNVRTTREGERTRIQYSVTLPVSWGTTSLPSSYTFTFPKNVGDAELAQFATDYGHTCVDFGAHDVDAGSMWYYYRPRASGCRLAAEDVVTVTATAVKSTENTTGKYPEYHKVWEDNALRVVAIFGKYEDGATTASDAGIAAYNTFLRAVRRELAAYGLVTTPAVVPESPGISVPDVTFTATLADGRTITITALLVDNVRTAGFAFDRRYAELSTRADLIAYNGHAGLGANVRALSTKGEFVRGQYAMFFMNGCDTFAYVDGYLAQERARLNSDDPTGTKYMEIITNAMPAFFSSMSNATLALVKGLVNKDRPLTYQQMFAQVDRSQVIVVTGEEDNVFSPTAVNPGWLGLDGQGSVAKNQEQRFETPVLPAGRYVFSITGTGDADLYVRDGAAPTTTTYACRPYKAGSSETCTLTLAAPAPVHVMVRGWAASSTFTLSGRPN